MIKSHLVASGNVVKLIMELLKEIQASFKILDHKILKFRVYLVFLILRDCFPAKNIFNSSAKISVKCKM